MRDVCPTLVPDTARGSPRRYRSTSPYLPGFRMNSRTAGALPGHPSRKGRMNDVVRAQLDGGRIIGGVVVEAPVALVSIGQLIGGRLEQAALLRGRLGC